MNECNRRNNVVFTLFERSNGNRRMTASSLPTPAVDRVDEAHKNIVKGIHVLRVAIHSQSWRQIENAVEYLILKLLDSQNPDALFTITPSKRLERELFVEFGGMKLMLSLLEGPLSKPDARHIPSSQIQRHVELWNEVLVILREVCFAVPSLSDSVFSDNHLVFLFTLLSHDFVFENTMNLLEEILAVRMETFCLSLVPDFYKLVGKFSTRRLAHFCRVLALLLFEPEDRQIMESSQVLRSFELLALRRQRMSKKSSALIERNQSIVIDLPCFFPRLITLLRIVNHGPTISELVRQEVQIPPALSADQFFMFMNSNRGGRSEWEHYDHLEDTLRSAENSSNNSEGQLHSQTTSAISENTGDNDSNSLSSALSNATATAISSAANTFLNGVGEGFVLPTDITDSAYFGFDDLDSDDELHSAVVEDVRQNQSASSLTQSLTGQSMNDLRNQMQDSFYNIIQSLQPSLQMQQFAGRSRTTSNVNASNASASAVTSAREELNFQALSLSPHQVELLFVLCTLLSGRRKIDVQNRLAAAGLGDVLIKMFNRMSWNAPAFEGHNPLEHVHGPNCECSPESALRVQYLRLLHNFMDRDFHNNPIPHFLLSIPETQRVFLYGRVANWNDDKMGLIVRVTKVLEREPFDSTYRFWLSSCIESFLRGTGYAEQCFLVQHTGILDHLVEHVTRDISTSGSSSAHPTSVSNLQTSFDLLGELVRYNREVVELLESRLLQNQSMDRFLKVVLRNLVDSNVFLRSLVLTVEKLGQRDEKNAESENLYKETLPRHLPSPCTIPLGTTGGYTLVCAGLSPAGEREEVCLRHALRSQSQSPSPASIASVSYLTHSWLQYTPKILSNEAIRLAKLHEKSEKTLNEKSKSKKSSLSKLQSPSRSMKSSEAQLSGKSRKGKVGDSSFTTSMREAFKSLRDVTNSFIRPRNESGTAVNGRQTARSISSNISLYDFKDALEDYESELKNESGGEVATSLQTNENIEISEIDDDVEKIKVTSAVGKLNYNLKGSKEGKCESKRIEIRASSSRSFQDLYDTEIVLSSSSRNLSSFLHVHRPAIIYKLMCVVTVRSVNHENICCINTTLLFLIFANRIGCLQILIHGLKHLAKSAKYHSASLEINNGNIDSDNKHEDVAEELGLWKPVQSLPGRNGLKNFRELLWYWTEYYQRRGRDRLSLEFSSHIPFEEWRNTVESLCADDGSPTALLSEPMSLPESPYVDTTTPDLTKYF